MTDLRLPYPVRWFTTTLQGCALGAGLLAFAGITALAGGLSVSSWLNGFIVLLVAGTCFGGAVAPLQTMTQRMNFIEKNVFTCACGLLVVGAYALAFGQLHQMRMLLVDHPEKREMLMRIIPSSEPSVLHGALWVAGGALGVGLLLMGMAGLSKRKPMQDNGAISCLMVSTAVLTFMGGRNAYFLLQAVS